MPNRINSYLPRNPRIYAPDDHFVKRVKNKVRPITLQLTEETIREGDILQDDQQGIWKFAQFKDGVSVQVVCTINEDNDPSIITGYCRVMEREKAEDSDFWSEDDIHNIDFFSTTGLYENWFGKLAGIKMTTPVYFKGHKIFTERDWNKVMCVECQEAFTTKSELENIKCRR